MVVLLCCIWLYLLQFVGDEQEFVGNVTLSISCYGDIWQPTQKNISIFNLVPSQRKLRTHLEYH